MTDEPQRPHRGTLAANGVRLVTRGLGEMAELLEEFGDNPAHLRMIGERMVQAGTLMLAHGVSVASGATKPLTVARIGEALGELEKVDPS